MGSNGRGGRGGAQARGGSLRTQHETRGQRSSLPLISILRKPSRSPECGPPMAPRCHLFHVFQHRQVLAPCLAPARAAGCPRLARWRSEHRAQAPTRPIGPIREGRPRQSPQPARVQGQPRLDGRLRDGGQPRAALPADRAGARRQRARSGRPPGRDPRLRRARSRRRGCAQGDRRREARPRLRRFLEHLARPGPRACAARCAQSSACRSRSSARR